MERGRGGRNRGRQRGGRGRRGRGRVEIAGYGSRGRPQSYHGRDSDNNLLMNGEEREGGERRGSPSKVIRPIGYKHLEEMEQKETPQDIVIFLASSRSGLEELLRSDMHQGKIQMLSKVFGKMLETDRPKGCLLRVLELIHRSDFLTKVISFVYELFTDSKDYRQRQAVVHVNNALKLMKSLLTVMPNDSEKKVRVSMRMLQTVVDGLGDLADGVQEDYSYVNEMLEANEVKKKVKIEKASRQEAQVDLHSQPAPDNFREIPVFPQLIDIRGDTRPFLRTNLINRAYLSDDHYLDVQFRLLREDFIQPLREGINEIILRGGFGQAKKQQRYQNVKVYEDVKVEYIKPDQRGIMHRINFSTEKLQNIRWNNTKRMLFGNLLCLSSDQFKDDVLFAVVADRKPEDLAEGYLTVQFVHDQEQEVNVSGEDDEYYNSDDEIVAAAKAPVGQHRSGPRIDMKKIYTMVETDAYFEAYRHVLAGLKETDHIPLERYIVHCSEVMHAPEYLRPSVAGRISYDFSPVTKRTRKVEVLGYDWPSTDDLRLNRSQTQALKLALTNELAIIQGPPGTGKTHVGLVIMKLLLKNKTRWFSSLKNETHCPILVVCYTNHALDQFLEGIAKFSSADQTIVRVGGRSKNEVTKQFSLNEIRRKRRQNKDKSEQSRAMRHTIWDIRNNLREIESLLQTNINQIEASLHCIQNVKELERSIPKRLYDQFCSSEAFGMADNDEYWSGAATQSPDDVLLSWLGLTGPSEKEVDYEQEARKLSGFSYACLRNMKYTDEEIGRAYVATGSPDPIVLHGWITINAAAQGYQQFGEPETFQEVVEAADADEGEVMEEADLLQEQRLVDTDEIEYRGRVATAEQNESHVKQLMNRMAALTFQDIGAKAAEDQDDGFKLQKRDKRKAKKKIRAELRRTTIMTLAEESRIRNINALSQEDRWRLYRTWVTRWRDQFRVGSNAQISKYNALARQLEELRRQEDAAILQAADVVAVTTTGAAKYRDLIYKLNTKIVVVEEAAEVLEAHIITSMPRDTKHLILIGDHQQLKPSPTVYRLATEYNLDTSLFERLIKVGIPHVTLLCQHRMRPEIADLIRPHIYKELDDHESVLLRPEITGVQKSIFFLSHEVPEESLADGKSKKNQYEADFLVSLTKYLITQGYKPEQITILAMYTGQILAFKNVMREKLCRGVRVTAVDNFQGEESDIILLSLVRSNAEMNIGFLKTENRICVALSRARNALYCVGNMQLLKHKSTMWRRIIAMLRIRNSIGEALMLQCKNHPDRLTPVKNVADFQKAPEGGCGQPCETRLDCGHTCPRRCHPEDHSKQRCQKRCAKTLQCEGNHLCKMKCWQECGPCTEKVMKIMPKCGHQQQVLCSEEVAQVWCMEMVQVNYPCGHQSLVQCHRAKLVTASMCTEKCQELLECNDTCKGSCTECFQGRLHIPCMAKCNRILVCGHACKSFCSSCPPCEDKCQTRCKHSRCGKKCGEPCTMCREMCKWKCPHYQCLRPCSEPCDRPPCNKPCLKKIKKCGHQCIGLCGEPCPELCRICDETKVQTVFFGDEDEENARFVVLEDCGHIFTYKSLDRWMNQKEQSNVIKMKECPRCKTMIWRSTRYGNVINKLLNAVNGVKKKMWGDSAADRRQLYREVKQEVVDTKFFKPEIEEIQKRIKENRSPTMLLVLEQRFRRLQKLRELMIARNKFSVTASSYLQGIDSDLKSILKWVCLNRTHSTKQEEESFSRETQRIKQILRLVDFEEKIKKMSVTSQVAISLEVQALRLLLKRISSFDIGIETKVNRLFEKILQKEPRLSSNLGISDEERTMICKAMGFAAKGHWYKCPRGHVYAIGECGGATETSVCPECRNQIGGTSHVLLSSNRLATEMDGATRPAFDVEMQGVPQRLLDQLALEGYQ